MKVKSLLMLATSSLMVASLAYVSPAIADEMGSATPGAAVQQNPNNTPDSFAMADNSMPSNPASDSSSGDGSSAPSNDMADNSDQGTPDTATGDDDY